mmetsp:Transcript_59873/g.185558  ORF Transcript_59873/g.185558 Transcript_59873/m.185558 type:complete len:579 (-) Transcript_59873:45-1781(-)
MMSNALKCAEGGLAEAMSRTAPAAVQTKKYQKQLGSSVSPVEHDGRLRRRSMQRPSLSHVLALLATARYQPEGFAHFIALMAGKEACHALLSVVAHAKAPEERVHVVNVTRMHRGVRKIEPHALGIHHHCKAVGSLVGEVAESSSHLGLHGVASIHIADVVVVLVKATFEHALGEVELVVRDDQRSDVGDPGACKTPQQTGVPEKRSVEFLRQGASKQLAAHVLHHSLVVGDAKRILKVVDAIRVEGLAHKVFTVQIGIVRQPEAPRGEGSWGVAHMCPACRLHGHFMATVAQPVLYGARGDQLPDGACAFFCQPTMDVGLDRGVNHLPPTNQRRTPEAALCRVLLCDPYHDARAGDRIRDHRQARHWIRAVRLEQPHELGIVKVRVHFAVRTAGLRADLPHGVAPHAALQDHLHKLANLGVEGHAGVVRVPAVLDGWRQVHRRVPRVAVCRVASPEPRLQDGCDGLGLRAVVGVAPILELALELVVCTHAQREPHPAFRAVVRHASSAPAILKRSFPEALPLGIGLVPPGIQLAGVQVDLPAQGRHTLELALNECRLNTGAEPGPHRVVHGNVCQAV